MYIYYKNKATVFTVTFVAVVFHILIGLHLYLIFLQFVSVFPHLVLPCNFLSYLQSVLLQTAYLPFPAVSSHCPVAVALCFWKSGSLHHLHLLELYPDAQKCRANGICASFLHIYLQKQGRFLCYTKRKKTLL